MISFPKEVYKEAEDVPETEEDQNYIEAMKALYHYYECAKAFADYMASQQ